METNGNQRNQIKGKRKRKRTWREGKWNEEEEDRKANPFDTTKCI